MNTLSPFIKKFSTAKKRKVLIILKDATLIYDKYYKAGTIFSILGWKEINTKRFLIISKGYVEILVDFDTFSDKMDVL
jgi:hypothetical protein